MTHPSGYETGRKKIPGPHAAMTLAGLAVFITSFLPWYGLGFGLASRPAGHAESNPDTISNPHVQRAGRCAVRVAGEARSSQ
jgi:hypothetical protein